MHKAIIKPSYRLYFFSVLSLILLGLLLYGYLSYEGYADHQEALPIVSFDLKGTVKTYSQQLAKKQFSQAQEAQLSAQFSQALTQTIHAYAESHQVVVLVQPAVIAGAPDVTREIQEMTLDALKTP